MNKLARFILVFVVLAAAILFVPPYIVGYSVEKEMLALEGKMPDHSGVNLSVKNYQRGWLSSTSQLVMTFTNDQSTDHAANPSITFDTRVYHGPFIFTQKTDPSGKALTFAKAYIVSTVSNPKNFPLSINAKIAFGDTVHAFVNANKITYQFQDSAQGTSLVFQGLNAKQVSSNQYTSVKTNLSMAAFDLFDKEQGHLQVKNISHESQFNEQAHNFWTGQGVTRIADLDLQTSKNAHLEVHNFKFEQSSKETNGRGTGTLFASIDSVSWNDKNFGQQNLSVTARNFDTEALKNLTEALETNSSQNIALLPFGKPFRAALIFLSKGVELSLDQFDINTEWGRIKADALLSLPESQTNLGTIQEVVETFKAIAHITLPEPLAINLLLGYLIQTAPENQQANITSDAATAQLTTFVEGGWIEKTSDNQYKLKIKVEKGQVYLNDKLFEMPAPSVPTVTSNTQPATTTTTTTKSGE